jgi:hypothetical protein
MAQQPPNENDENVERVEQGREEPEPSKQQDADLQRQGNLGNERNRNEPDAERQPGGRRENMNP